MIQYFHDGGFFMWPILALLIFGIAIFLERLYTLLRASVNTGKFMAKIRTTLLDEGYDAAVDVCAKTRGPVAEIFHAGLSRVDRGIDAVEKSIENAGSIEMAFLEKNMVWLSTVVTLAPMLGFTGTVRGMIVAFEDIKAAADISPSIVAGGISIALLTTLFGLIVAIFVQTGQNFLISRVDKLIIDMEENSVLLLDELTELKYKGKVARKTSKKARGSKSSAEKAD